MGNKEAGEDKINIKSEDAIIKDINLLTIPSWVSGGLIFLMSFISSLIIVVWIEKLFSGFDVNAETFFLLASLSLIQIIQFIKIEIDSVLYSKIKEMNELDRSASAIPSKKSLLLGYDGAKKFSAAFEAKLVNYNLKRTGFAIGPSRLAMITKTPQVTPKMVRRYISGYKERIRKKDLLSGTFLIIGTLGIIITLAGIWTTKTISAFNPNLDILANIRLLGLFGKALMLEYLVKSIDEKHSTKEELYKNVTARLSLSEHEQYEKEKENEEINNTFY